MNVAFQLITCEEGLGKLSWAACGRRWLIAHDKLVTGNKGEARQIKDSPCRSCTFGESRSKAPQRADGANTCTVVPVGTPPPDPSDVRAVVARRVEEFGRSKARACERCDEMFSPPPGRGAPPKRCPACRAKPKDKSARRQLAQESGRTETRTCALASCGKPYTHTATRGAMPIYCTPECARRAELDSSRERKRLARLDAGMAPRAYIVEPTSIVEAKPSPPADVFVAMLEATRPKSALDEQRAVMARLTEHRARLVQELDAAQSRVIELRAALDEVDGEPHSRLMVVVGKWAKQGTWGVTSDETDRAKLEHELREFADEDPDAVYVFELFFPVDLDDNGIAIERKGVP